MKFRLVYSKLTKKSNATTGLFSKEIELILLILKYKGGGGWGENININCAYTNIITPIDHCREQVVAFLSKENIPMYYLLHVKDNILTYGGNSND